MRFLYLGTIYLVAGPALRSLTLRDALSEGYLRHLLPGDTYESYFTTDV